MHVFLSSGGSSRALEVVGAQPSGREPSPRSPSREGDRDDFTDAPEALESWLTECIDIERQVRAWLAEQARVESARKASEEQADPAGSA